jgi:hypothetical protein
MVTELLISLDPPSTTPQRPVIFKVSPPPTRALRRMDAPRPPARPVSPRPAFRTRVASTGWRGRRRTLTRRLDNREPRVGDVVRVKRTVRAREVGDARIGIWTGRVETEIAARNKDAKAARYSTTGMDLGAEVAAAASSIWAVSTEMQRKPKSRPSPDPVSSTFGPARPAEKRSRAGRVPPFGSMTPRPDEDPSTTEQAPAV